MWSEIFSCLGFVVVPIINLIKGPGLTLMEIGTDIANVVHYSNPCLLPGFSFNDGVTETCEWISKDELNLTEIDYNHSGCVHILEQSWNTYGNSAQIIKSTFERNKTSCKTMLKNDPTWATMSGLLLFSPGWILAIYLFLNVRTWWDTDDRAEFLAVIIIGFFGFPFMLIVLQLWNWFVTHKKKENDFLTDFLPTILGVEAFGDAAPQVVLNGFVIVSKYPLGKIQLAGLIISLLATTLRVLEYDFIHEMFEKNQSSKSVLSYITMEKSASWSEVGRVLGLFFFYLLCNVARSASLCCIFLYCRQAAILPVLINMAFVTYLIKVHHKGDWSSCFMFSITNLFICSNGGPDDIKATTFKLMASTTKVCMGVFVTFQLGSMFLAYKMRGDPFATLKRYSERLDFGSFGKASSGWFCAWVIFLNVVHFILLHVIKKWLPKTEWEIRMDLHTKSKENQMKDQGVEYIQREKQSNIQKERKSKKGSTKSNSNTSHEAPLDEVKTTTDDGNKNYEEVDGNLMDVEAQPARAKTKYEEDAGRIVQSNYETLAQTKTEVEEANKMYEEAKTIAEEATKQYKELTNKYEDVANKLTMTEADLEKAVERAKSGESKTVELQKEVDKLKDEINIGK